MEEFKISLTKKESFLNIIEAGLNCIPYVGSIVSTLYFGRKNEMRFNRIENFYKILKDDFDIISSKVRTIENSDKEALAGIIEEINEKVERDHLESKLIQFRNCFYNSLILQTKDTYDLRKYFIHVLDQLSIFDIRLLKELSDKDQIMSVQMKNIKSGENYDQYFVSVHKLTSFGLLTSKFHGTLTPGMDFTNNTAYLLSDTGKAFIQYCMEVKV